MKPAPVSANASSADSEGLGTRIRSRDAGAWEALMRLHNRRLYRVARSILRNDGDAEDALQEAYLAAYRAIATFRGESSLATWLTHIVVNECMTRLRRQARRDNIVPIVAMEDMEVPDDHLPLEDQGGSGPETPDRALARAELRTLLERKIDELPAGFRSVFVMRALEEMSVEEVAEVLRIPEATVRSRFFRARAQLRESLAREIDLALDDTFAFDGARCDRIVAAVLQVLTRQPRAGAGDATRRS